MTSLNAPILFNSSEGSDTQSSGSSAGANVYGTGASTTASSAVVTGIDTTGVQQGDLLWVQSSSGRQFSVIFSVDSSSQVTCDDTFANTESSRTWAIGGKRASIAGSIQTADNWTADFKDGFIIQFESGYTEAFPSSLRARTGGAFTIRAEPNASVRPKLTAGGTFVFGQGSGYLVKGIEFTKSSSGGNVASSGSGGDLIFSKCKFGDSSNLGSRAYSTDRKMIFDRCEFTASNEGIYTTADLIIRGCVFNGGSKGVSFNYPSNQHSIHNCLFNGCDIGVHGNTWGGDLFFPKIIEANIFNCVDAGIQIPANNSFRQRGMLCTSNIFINSTYGVEFVASTLPTTSSYNLFESNAFYNIGTSNYLNDDGNIYNDITLTADPFVDAANGDFNLNATNGGGGTLRSTNYTLGG